MTELQRKLIFVGFFVGVYTVLALMNMGTNPV